MSECFNLMVDCNCADEKRDIILMSVELSIKLYILLFLKINYTIDLICIHFNQKGVKSHTMTDRCWISERRLLQSSLKEINCFL